MVLGTDFQKAKFVLLQLTLEQQWVRGTIHPQVEIKNNIFGLWLVESMDVKPGKMECQLYIY